MLQFKTICFGCCSFTQLFNPDFFANLHPRLKCGGPVLLLSAIPNFMPSKHAYASAANGEGTFLWITVFITSRFPLISQPTSPVADLKVLLSSAASNLIDILGTFSCIL
uniref:Uncharacterized protein n=1 Tax=Gossypium raimondii TaxID=29730 RepID=A0A0D2VBD5_GOSRA|nr:hypothetical protein B456_013G092100 [Gossypium raimondii]